MDLFRSELYVNDLKKTIFSIDLKSFYGKTFLITGGLGLVCSAIVDLLIDANLEYDADIKIYVADINSSLFETKYSNKENVFFINYNSINQIDFSFDVDFIIVGAGLANPNLYVSKPIETMLSNANGVRNLLEYAKKHSAKRVLYISSSEIYGKNEYGRPFLETDLSCFDTNNIRSSYACTKSFCELLCKSYAAEVNSNTVIVRPGHIFGPSASPFDTRVSSDFCFKAARGENIILKSSGLQTRSYCYSLDCAKAILTVLLHGKKGESYNISNEEQISIKQLSEFIAKCGGVDLLYTCPKEIEAKVFNPMNNSCLDCTKLFNLGYRPSFCYEKGIDHTIKIIKDLYYK